MSKPKADWQIKADADAEIARKELEEMGPTINAQDIALWFQRNRQATYRRLVRVLYERFGLS